MAVSAPSRPQPLETRGKSLPSPNGRWAGYLALLGARMREMWREPEIIFWVFGFPILLAFGLGIAFRNKPADAVPVAIVSSPAGNDALALIQRSPMKNSVRAQALNEDMAMQGFRLGKFDLVIQANPAGGFQYRYDPAR